LKRRELDRMLLSEWNASPQTEKDIYIWEVTYFNNRKKAASLSLRPYSLVPERKARHVMLNEIINPSLFVHER
jgi:hypothetical protein